MSASCNKTIKVVFGSEQFVVPQNVKKTFAAILKNMNRIGLVVLSKSILKFLESQLFARESFITVGLVTSSAVCYYGLGKISKAYVYTN